MGECAIINILSMIVIPTSAFLTVFFICWGWIIIFYKDNILLGTVFLVLGFVCFVTAIQIIDNRSFICNYFIT